MRPVRIELEGFGPFSARTVIDFADVDLGALVGPTGSGKSTVIDAITFALYGSVARYDNTKLVAPVIHQLSAEAKVRLEFETSGQRWLATRIVRRTTSKAKGDGTLPAARATTKEARLERVGSDGTTTVIAGSVKELDVEVAKLTGLDFAQFTRTIVLPQGEFAQFLKDDASSRQKLLRTLLDIDIYNAMGKLARERAASAEQQRSVYADELAKLAAVTQSELDAAKKTVASLDTLREEATGAVAQIDQLEADLVGKREMVRNLDRQRRGLAAIEMPAAAAAAGEEVAQAVEEVGVAVADQDHRRAIVEKLRDAFAQLGPDAATAIERKINAVSSMTSLMEGLSQRNEELTAAQATRAELASAVTRAESMVEVAQEAFTKVSDTPSQVVASLRTELTAGAPCPVCEQTVVLLPDLIDTAEAEEANAGALRELRDAQHTYTAARDAVTRQEANIEQLQARIRADEAARDATEKQFPDLLTVDVAELQEEQAAIQAQYAELHQAEKSQRNAESVVVQAQRQLEQCRQREQQFQAGFTQQRDAVAELGPPPPDGELIPSWRALELWAADVDATLEVERVERAEDGKALAAEKQRLIMALNEKLAPFGLAYQEGSVIADIAAAKARAEAEVDSVAATLQRKRELREKAAELAERHTMHDAMGKHLSARGFERWLLAEALDTIVVQATQRLQELSAGRYSLEATETGFQVRDHANADEARDVRTLSGGEIFLASLALALALADSIAALAPVDAPRLESIFLDEGFGTLDPETLDVVASAIEELAVGGRMVVLITHVRELAERMPIRFEVARQPGGATVERVEV